MQIEWVNHASFIVESDDVRLLTDPWIEGTAFNHGWKLVSPTVFKYKDFASITHIWFSHEHPDHFSPPNLKCIPEDIRQKITVLFHMTKDKRVLKVCRAYGFAVQELSPDKVIEIAKGFSVVCGRQGLIDSWIAMYAVGKTLLNMNDCVYKRREELAAIKYKVGKIDVSLSQFSYANWVGNADDRASHAKHARRKLNEIELHVQTFEPATFIPCASFIYFSHSENCFMNASANRITSVYDFTSRTLGVPTVVLYPGDRWKVGEPWDSGTSLRKYEADLERALAQSPDISQSIELPRLQDTATAFFRKALHKNNRLLLKAIPPAVVRLHDLGIDVELSYRAGLRQVKGRKPDIATSSDSLSYCLQYDWGGDTLAVNGRYQIPTGGNARNFFRIFRVAAHNSAGNSFDFLFLGQQVVKKVAGALNFT